MHESEEAYVMQPNEEIIRALWDQSLEPGEKSSFR
jgi:hypothetical protein